MKKPPSIVLGISYGHGDSSAALIVDGCVVAAAEEERFSRIKHDAGFPEQAIQYCLKHAELTSKDVQAIALAKKPRAHFLKKLVFAFKNPGAVPRANPTRKSYSLSTYLRKLGLNRAGRYTVEHHHAHLHSVLALAPNQDLSLLSIDGLGDFVSTTLALKKKNEPLAILKQVFFPHSLGFFYTAMTQYLGFNYFGDEYKVMGLSSYGSPKYLNALRELIRTDEQELIQLNMEAFPLLKEPLHFTIENNQPYIAPFFHRNFLIQMLGINPRKPREKLEQEHSDLAKSIQCRFEEVAFYLLKKLYELTAVPNLALSGGCAHNSVWVGKILENSPFKKIYVPPAAHDAGIALGAAVAVAGVPLRPEGGHWALLGPQPTDFPNNFENSTVIKNDRERINWIVERLAEGDIVGLCDGRMEFGPRALGSRSILADPRRKDMRDRLNQRVKHRETFRPFAASVMEEYQKDWFVGAFPSPNMEAVFKVNPKNTERIPALVHADGTCRIQTVEKHNQKFYWELLEAFRKKTNVPMLINTSFNDSEPIVCTNEDALRCFEKTDLDHLVIGDRVFSKKKKLSMTG